ncbi:MAG: dTDP-4-dehydrorhamnose 3,5-epimerase [Bacteroidota bacterium]|nr:dTDP-4-dehydrorhamnose 3,5-epimerase [Bacteroidota bacterium]
MEIIKTKIPDLLIIKPKIFEDHRGYFFESYNEKLFNSNNINIKFVQDNQSFSSYGTIRGLHYQLAPYAQTKLIRVLQGKIYDVAIDIRENSPTFGKWFGQELSSDNKLQLLVPQGFAHGFSVLSETATVLYKCDNLYNPESERGINFLDKELNIDWKIEKNKAIVSSKDNILPALIDAEINFKF